MTQIFVKYILHSCIFRHLKLQMTKNRTPTPVYLDPGMHPGLEVKGLTLRTLKYLCINHGDQRVFFQFEIIIDPSRHMTLNQCWFTLVHRRRRWNNIKPTLIQRLVCWDVLHSSSRFI